jgi:hypothetical protein
MTFGQPWMLLGALAALIPLLVHLFDRRRPRQVPFAALDFVLKSQRRTAARLRLKRLLLYALRTFVLLAIPFALSKPSFESDVSAGPSPGLAATAYVVDTSLAMRWADGKSLFELAQDETRSAIRELTSDEPAVLVPCTSTPAAAGPLGFNRAELVELIDHMKPGFEVVELNRCLEFAARLLTESPLPNRRLVVVSAMTQNALRLDVGAPMATGPKGESIRPDIVLRDVARTHPTLPNRALVDLRSEAAPQLGNRGWQFTFTIRNFSDESLEDVELKLAVNSEVVAKGFVDLAPRGTVQKTLAHRFSESGVVTVSGVLESDALPDDDVRSMVIVLPRELKALVVNGEPNAQKHRDEAFFLDAALSETGSPVEPVIRDFDAAWREDFARYDVIFLLNVETPSSEHVRRLGDFVKAGGGLFISFGSHTEPDAWNEIAGDLLPRKLRVVKTAVEPGSVEGRARAARLEDVKTDHPIFSPFSGKAGEGLLSTKFSRYVLLEADARGNESRVLGRLDDGAPAFVSGTLGRGRILLFASSVDSDWCDIPIRTSFLPLIQRMAGWLSRSLDERELNQGTVGASMVLHPEAGATPVVARAPSGSEVALAPTQPNAAVSGGPLPEPGTYTVLDSRGEPIDALAFAATIDSAASDLTRHKLETMTAWFGEDVVKIAGGSGADKSTPLWTWLIVAALMAFFFEGLVLRS